MVSAFAVAENINHHDVVVAPGGGDLSIGIAVGETNVGSAVSGAELDVVADSATDTVDTQRVRDAVMVTTDADTFRVDFASVPRNDDVSGEDASLYTATNGHSAEGGESAEQLIV
jgi:carbamate kinase